ncbi:hypothetical protein Tco_1548780 [Tanacetum coccineum]
MGKFKETLVEGAEGALHLGPERDRVIADLTLEEKDMYKADIRAMNILLQGLPKDIYTLINHYTDAKDIWDNVKMLLMIVNLNYTMNLNTSIKTKEKPFTNTMSDLALTVDNIFQADQCDAFDSDVDEAPTAQTMLMVNLSSVDPIYDETDPSYDSDILSEVQDLDNYQDAVDEHHEVHEMYNDVQLNYVVDSDDEYTSGSNVILYDQYVKDKAELVVHSNVSYVPNDAYMMIINEMHKQATQCVSANKQNKVVIASLTAKLARYKEQVKLYKRRARITPTGLIEGERGIPKVLTKEVKEMKEIFEQMEAEVDQNAVEKKSAEIERKNLLIENENLIVDCLSKEVFYTVINYVLTLSRFSEMHEAYTAEQARCMELKAKLSKLKHKIQKDDDNEMIKHFSNLEIDHLNLQLKCQNLKERFGNNKSEPSQDALEFDTVFKINKMKASLQGKDNIIRKLREQISQIKEIHSEADCILDFKA